MQAKDFLTMPKLSGNYILVGDDAYLRSVVVKSAMSHLPDGLSEFNFTSIDGGKDVALDIVPALMIAPLMSDIRIVYVKEIREKLSKDSIAMLKDYLSHPSSESVLIINDEKGYASMLKKDMTIVDCASYTNNDSVDFVKTHAKELGGSINHGAARLLSEYCQYDMMRIDTELKKLIEYKESELIVETDVKEFVHADVEYEIYEIANAVGDKNLTKALAVIHSLMQGGFKPSDILSQLSRAFRRMLYIKISPLNDDEIGRVLDIKPFAVKKTRGRVDKFTTMKLKKIYDNINEMEYKFKSGVMSDSSALDDALVNIFA